MARRKSRRSWVFGVSVGAHLALGAVLALVPQEKLREVVAIALNEAPKPEKKPEPPKPPPREDRPARAAGQNARPSHGDHAAPAPAGGAPVFTDIGLALDSSASDGLAIRMAAPAPVQAPPPPPPAKPKFLVAKPDSSVSDVFVKPRLVPSSIKRPQYTDAARQAGISGIIWIELTVDETGNVVGAKVLRGLGYGLDEVALDAAKHSHFVPATRGGKPASGTFIVKMRFGLGS